MLGEELPRHRSVMIGDLGQSALRSPAGPGGPRSIGPSEDTIDVLIELNVAYPGGIEVAVDTFLDLWRVVVAAADPPAPTNPARTRARKPRPPAPATPPGPEPRRINARLFQCVVTPGQLQALVAADRDPGVGRPPVIFKAWPDYPMYPQIDRSAPTVKSDAAWRSFNARGNGIVWAVIDSGIQADHRHFAGLDIGADAAAGRNPAGGVAAVGDAAAVDPAALQPSLHRDFTDLVAPSQLGPLPGPPSPLTDELGHGSHVAGIIAGSWTDAVPATPLVASSQEPTGDAGFVQRTRTGVLSGMAPECQLVSLKVMRRNRQGNWVTSSAAVIAALEYIRTEVNVSRNAMRIHGVNLSLGCDWDPSHYAAGQSPLCQTITELVASGVVVVVSSGNGGSTVAANDARQSMSLMGTVTEPGHAEACITVGSTHRDAPLAFGISWTSGKGPTLDGRSKPDVVAPGEWITSVAAGQFRAAAGIADTDQGRAYLEESGTSMAAPHVSGVIAGFLSARPEYIGRPELVKQLLCRTATDLGRERYAQGAGLIDEMRMLSNS